MVDRLRPATLLIAALAMWSLGLLLSSAIGLGGRISPYADDPSLQPSIPTLNLRQAGQRLAAISEYEQISSRPLFSPDRKPAPIAATAGGQAEEVPFEATLTSVILSGDTRLAILTESDGASKRVKLGEPVPGLSWRLIDLEPRRAVFEGPSGQRSLDLRVFDGQGGAAPTQLSTPTPSPRNEAQARLERSGRKDEPDSESKEAEQEARDQQAQIEAIRRRIEARRAQMRAEAEEEMRRQNQSK